jgi:hypothetical protein
MHLGLTARRLCRPYPRNVHNPTSTHIHTHITLLFPHTTLLGSDLLSFLLFEMARQESHTSHAAWLVGRGSGDGECGIGGGEHLAILGNSMKK